MSALEIYRDGVDRFARCPPSGDLGQAWIPARFADAPHDPALTEKAIEQTLKPFRACYNQGTLHQEGYGRAALVLHLDEKGHVSSVENTATCGLPIPVIDCMFREAEKLVLAPKPGDATRTVVIPSVFAPRDGYPSVSPTPQDAYLASVHLALEDARPDLHDCNDKAPAQRNLVNRWRPNVIAQGVFALDVNAQGRVVRWSAEPWDGSPALRSCVGGALQKVAFPPRNPADGAPGARILARIAFNPDTR